MDLEDIIYIEKKLICGNLNDIDLVYDELDFFQTLNRLAYQNVINVGDRVYLSDGQLAESELEKIAMSDNEYCEKANYSVYVVLPQNYKTQIDFMKR